MSLNRAGRRTRAELLDAGWRVVDRLTFADLLTALNPGRVAARAGRSPGAFRHHFPTRDDLAAAMLDDLVARADALGAEVSAADLPPGLDGMLRPVRDTADDLGERDPAPATQSLRFAVVVSRAAADEAAAEAARRERRALRDGLRGRDEVLMAAIGREQSPPLTDDHGIVIGLSQAFWLLMRARHDHVGTPSLSDAWVYAVLAITRPRGSTGTLDDLVLELAPSERYREQVAKAPARRPNGATWLLPVLELTADGWADRSFNEVAALLDRSPDELRARFGTMRRLAAEAFGCCLGDLEGAAARHRDRDPHRAVADVLVELARWAGRCSVAARALLEERREELARPSREESLARASVTATVPIDGVVRDAVVAAEAADEVDAPARRVAAAVDVTLTIAATRTRLAPATVAAIATEVLGLGSRDATRDPSP